MKAIKIIIGIILFIGIINIFIPLKQKGKPINPSAGQTENKEKLNEGIDHTIEGLSPVDIYLNMENQGFSTDKNLSSQYGNTWTNKKSYAGIDYTVETFSSSVDNVEMVRATAMVDLNQKKIIATQQFFNYIVTLPYDNSQPEKARSWLNENFNNDKASVEIGSAKITIFAPSKALRMVNIESNTKQ